MNVFRDVGHGYDEFGANDRVLDRAVPVVELLHDRYFRVMSHGVENVPAQGGAVLVSNHSGTLPFDGVMIFTNVHKERGRVVRPVADRFVPLMPFIGTFFARVGVVTGTGGNLRFLLERGELLLIFPEGTTGIGKPFASRYQIQDWRVGHAELAIRHGVPVVPVAVIGAEEQMPQLARIERGAKLVGAPYIPIALPLFPLPVRYHLHYGPPIDLSAYDPDDAASLRAAAQVTKAAVEALIAEGLAQRTGVFT